MRRWTREGIGKDKSLEDAVPEMPGSTKEASVVSDKKRLLTLIICLGFGIFGAHRFYAGKRKTGMLMLVTIGGLGIWYVIDCLIVLFGEFKDNKGRKIKQWM